MPDIAKFQLGPLAVGVQGNHPCVTWAKHAFKCVSSDNQPSILFQFTDNAPIHCPDSIAYHLPRFDLEVSKTTENGLQVDIFQRDRRSLLMRSLSDPAKSWRTWFAHGGSLDIGVIKDFAYKTSPILLQCAMLNNGCSLAHAASFAVDDQALLLVAGSGVGKTSVLLQTVLNGKAKFLSDDHAIVNRDGIAYLHPMPMHLYGHSLKSNPQLRRFDSWQWRTCRKLDAQHAVRWISPADIFGIDQLARQARLNEVIIIVHGAENQLTQRFVDPTQAGELCASLTIEELHDFDERLTTAPPNILPTAATATAETRRVFESAFANRICSVVTVPRKTRAESITQFLQKHSPLFASAFT